MKRLLLVIILSPLIFSCNKNDKSGSLNSLHYSWITNFSDIRFFRDDHLDYPFTNKEIDEQILIINTHDPIKDSNKAHSFNNNRFIGFMGIGLIIPGVEYENLNHNDKTKALALWGLTDVSPDRKLQISSFRYCYLYNTNILKLTNREHLKKEPEPRELAYILEYFPDFKP